MTTETVPHSSDQPVAEHREIPACPLNNSVPRVLRPSNYKHELILIEIGTGRDNIFKQIHRSTSSGDRAYQIYLDAKELCLNDFRRRGYVYPITLVDDHDAHSVFFFSREKSGEINGVLRVCFDSRCMLPMSGSVPQEFARLRKLNFKLAEPGRFSLKPGLGLFSRFIPAIYQLAIFCSVDYYLLQVRPEHASFYRRTFGADPLPSATAPDGCKNLRWDIQRTSDRFFKAFGEDQNDLSRLLNSNTGEML